jgi:ankyrin repeat protein
MEGHKSIVTYLLALEDTSHLSKLRKSLLKEAAANGDKDLLKMLAANHRLDVDVRVAERYTIKVDLYHAVRYGKAELVTELLPLAGPDYDVPDRNGCSMLMSAALNGLEYDMEYFLDKGANVMRRGNFQKRVL